MTWAIIRTHLNSRVSLCVSFFASGLVLFAPSVDLLLLQSSLMFSSDLNSGNLFFVVVQNTRANRGNRFERFIWQTALWIWNSLSINYSYYRPEEYSWQVDSIYGRQEYCINSLISWVSDSYLFPCRSSRLDYGNLRCVDSSFSCMQRCFRLFVNTLLVSVVFGRGICVGNPYSMTYIYTAYYEIDTRFEHTFPHRHWLPVVNHIEDTYRATTLAGKY